MDNEEKCHDNVKYKHKEKFSDTIFVRCAINSFSGKSEKAKL